MIQLAFASWHSRCNSLTSQTDALNLGCDPSACPPGDGSTIPPVSLQERSQVRIRRRPRSSPLAAFFFAPIIRPFHPCDGAVCLADCSVAHCSPQRCRARCATAQVPGADQVQAVTLANGMQIIVWPDRDIPNVALYNWVRVGSRNEVPGITGLAHFFEHMMFNGTTTRRAGRVRSRARSERRAQQRVHFQRRHRVPGLVPARGARDRVRSWRPTACAISRSIRK